MSPGVVGVVGKLPGFADFVRLGAQPKLFEHLLTWLVDGTERSAALRRDAPALLAGGRVHAFVYRAGAGSTFLAGVLGPSEDQAGRSFPIAAAAELPVSASLLQEPGVLPIVLERVWAVMGQLVTDLQSQDRETILALPAWQVEMEASPQQGLATYRAWTEELPVQDLLALVFAGDVARAARALAMTEEAVRPYRGIEGPTTPLSLRLPLGECGGAAVCFWIDVVRRLLGWRQTLPSFFWWHDGSSGVLMLHLGQVSVRAFAELWFPTGACDEVCDLALPGPGTWQHARIAVWQELLLRPGLVLSELLEAAG
jgi:type VI secretion system ImpM family protein